MPTSVPPQLPEYQYHEAPVPNDPPDTDKVEELPEHIGFWLALIPAGAVDALLIVTIALP